MKKQAVVQLTEDSVPGRSEKYMVLEPAGILDADTMYSWNELEIIHDALEMEYGQHPRGAWIEIQK